MTEDNKREAPVHLDLKKLHGFRHLATTDDAEGKLEKRAEDIFNKIGTPEGSLQPAK